MCFVFIFSYQRDDEDGDDMDSYQVSLLSILWHGAQLLLTASSASRGQGGGRRGIEQEYTIFHLFFICFKDSQGYNTVSVDFSAT